MQLAGAVYKYEIAKNEKGEESAKEHTSGCAKDAGAGSSMQTSKEEKAPATKSLSFLGNWFAGKNNIKAGSKSIGNSSDVSLEEAPQSVSWFAGKGSGGAEGKRGGVGTDVQVHVSSSPHVPSVEGCHHQSSPAFDSYPNCDEPSGIEQAGFGFYPPLSSKESRGEQEAVIGVNKMASKASTFQTFTARLNQARDLKRHILARIAAISDSNTAAAASIAPDTAPAADGLRPIVPSSPHAGAEGHPGTSANVAEIVDERPSAIQEEAMQLIEEFQARVRQHGMWSSAGAEELDAADEAIERLVTHKLYNYLFAATRRDLARDTALHHRILCLQFLEAGHLDIDSQVLLQWNADSCLQVARREICKMNDYKSPKDKLVCLYNCCKLATRVLTLTVERSTGADELLPLLILLLIQANPPSLHSNLSFIANCRHPSRLNGEQGYFLTNILSAVQFLSEVCDEQGVLVHQRALSIDPVHFQRQFSLVKVALQAHTHNSGDEHATNSDAQRLPPAGPPAASAAVAAVGGSCSSSEPPDAPSAAACGGGGGHALGGGACKDGILGGSCARSRDELPSTCGAHLASVCVGDSEACRRRCGPQETCGRCGSCSSLTLGRAAVRVMHEAACARSAGEGACLKALEVEVESGDEASGTPADRDTDRGGDDRGEASVGGGSRSGGGGGSRTLRDSDTGGIVGDAACSPNLGSRERTGDDGIGDGIGLASEMVGGVKDAEAESIVVSMRGLAGAGRLHLHPAFAYQGAEVDSITSVDLPHLLSHYHTLLRAVEELVKDGKDADCLAHNDSHDAAARA